MVTIDQIQNYLEQRIAEEYLTGDEAGLRRVQTAAGMLMEAVHAAGDAETAVRFQFLAAAAANKLEALHENH